MDSSRQQQHADEDSHKGAVEQDRPSQETNVSLAGQSGHRDQDPMVKSSDSDFPEPGQNEEHSGEPRAGNQLERDTDGCRQGALREQGPGSRQQENQNKGKDDPGAV